MVVTVNASPTNAIAVIAPMEIFRVFCVVIVFFLRVIGYYDSILRSLCDHIFGGRGNTLLYHWRLIECLISTLHTSLIHLTSMRLEQPSLYPSPEQGV